MVSQFSAEGLIPINKPILYEEWPPVMFLIFDGIHITEEVPANLSLEGIHSGIGTRQGNRLNGSVCLRRTEVLDGDIAGICYMCLDRI